MKQVKTVSANQPKINGKWTVEFDFLQDGESVAIVESAALFNSDMEALFAGWRAEKFFTENGKFPDLCAAF